MAKTTGPLSRSTGEETNASVTLSPGGLKRAKASRLPPPPRSQRTRRSADEQLLNATGLRDGDGYTLATIAITEAMRTSHDLH